MKLCRKPGEWIAYGLTALALGLGSNVASATVMLEASPVLPAGYTAATPCATSEVTLSGANSDVCAGYYDVPNGPGGSSPTNETSLVNAVTTGDDWVYMGKWDTDNSAWAGSGSAPYNIYLDGAANSNNGTFTLEWTGLTSDLVVDLAFGMKAGQMLGFFFYSDETLMAPGGSQNGTYAFSFRQGLSHEGLWIRVSDTPTPPNSVPAPGTLLLFAAPLLALGLGFGRKKKN